MVPLFTNGWDPVQFTLFVLPICVLLMCNTVNVNRLALRTSRLQNGCNGTVISQGSLTGRRQADSLPSPWYRHNTYHLITIVITKTVFLPLSTSKGHLKSTDDFLCICCCRRMKPQARSTWPSTPATCRWSSGFQSALGSDGSRWWTQARKHRMTSSLTVCRIVLSPSTNSLISSTPTSTLCSATLLSSLYCALMSKRREYIKEYTWVVVL